MASIPVSPTPGAASTAYDIQGGAMPAGASAITPEADSAAGGPGARAGAGAAGGAGAAMPSAGEVKQQAKAAVGDLKQQAQSLRGQAVDRARSAADEGKTKASGLLSDVASNAHEVADKLRQSQAAPLATYVEQFAGYAANFADTLKNRPVDDLVAEARDYARRSPGVAVGVAVALGFAFARFLKASAPETARRY